MKICEDDFIEGSPKSPDFWGEEEPRREVKGLSFGLLLPSSASDDEGRRQAVAKGTDNKTSLKSDRKDLPIFLLYK